MKMNENDGSPWFTLTLEHAEQQNKLWTVQGLWDGYKVELDGTGMQATDRRRKLRQKDRLFVKVVKKK